MYKDWVYLSCRKEKTVLMTCIIKTLALRYILQVYKNKPLQINRPIVKSTYSTEHNFKPNLFSNQLKPAQKTYIKLSL